jgi:small nuclear ribonucleoprotein (snRNP)-like protein
MTQVLRGFVASVLGLVLALLPAIASAQDASKDPTAAAIGKDVTVTTKDGAKYKGKLKTLSLTEVVIDQAKADHKFAVRDVQQVQRNSQAMRKGATWGFGIGLGVGVAGMLLVGASDGNGDQSGEEAMLLILTSVGISTGAGAGLGAAFRGSGASRMLYQAPTKTTVSVSPTLGKGKLGIAGTIKW